jgi:dolichyl-phosphate beta-glucosyltransferase
MGRKKKLSIIIPAYNEGKIIADTFRKLMMTFKGINFEIVIVNDGSTDDTRRVLRNIKSRRLRVINLSRNRGKGYAVRKGLISSKHDEKLVLDADLSVAPIEYFCYDKENFDMLNGRRIYDVRQPLSRLVLRHGFRALTWLATGIYADTQCPFKILRLPPRIYREMTVDGFAYDVELLLIAKSNGYIIINGDVIYNHMKDSKVTLQKSIKMFIDVIHLKR